MGVVVEGAPANAACILRVRGKLVVDAGMANGVLGQALDLIDGLGGISVANELGVQITRIIWRLERKAEIVHGENVCQEFRFLKITDATGLARGIELTSQGVRARVEIVIVARLVDAYAPQNYAG